MSMLAWIILGLVAGFIASKIVNRHGEGIILDVLLGIVGSVVGGWLFHSFGRSGVTGLNLESLLVATIGAAVVLVVYHMLFRSSRWLWGGPGGSRSGGLPLGAVGPGFRRSGLTPALPNVGGPLAPK